jgi:RHS repeat-associated protein
MSHVFKPGPLFELFVIACISLLICLPMHGQTTVGVQKFGAYDGFPDTIDVGSLGLHLEIPLYSRAGRGKDTAITFTLDNYTGYGRSVQGVNGVWHTIDLGPRLFPGLPSTGSVTSTSRDHQCVGMTGSGYYTDHIWTYVDAHGNSHLFPGTSRDVYDNNNTCATHHITGYDLIAQASDGSGFSIRTGIHNATITTPSGTSFWDFNPNWGGAANIRDSNGNTLSLIYPCNINAIPCQDDSGNPVLNPFQDTVNASIQITGGGYDSNYTARQPLVITYLDDNGTSQTITLNYRTYTYTTGNSTSTFLLDSVVYPDGSAYHFTYVQDSSGTVLTAAPLASITLPPGGVISYGYPGGVNLCGSNPAYIPSLTRTTSDGTTTYTRTITGSTCAVTSSYTDITNQTTGDKTTVYFVVPQHYAACLDCGLGSTPSTVWQADLGKTLETKRLEYSHTNLTTPIRTIARCYNGATGDCTSAPVNEPVTQVAVTTTLDNGLSNQVVTQFTGLGLPTEVDEYDFGASTPARKTVTTYAALSNNISDRPDSVTVYDSAGNIAQKTTYGYDGPTPPPMTLPGHTTIASGSRGNLTSASEWINSSGTSQRVTGYAYDDAGQTVSMADPNQNVTSYAYDQATDAYRTTITRPTTSGVAHVQTFGYGPNSGLVTSAVDENNKQTTYAYDLMLRPSSITYPDGGQTTYSYTSTSKTIKVLQKTGVLMTSTEQYDGYGRKAHSTTADGATTDYTYDSLGQVSSVSNPHFSTPSSTDGSTSYEYDALGRQTKITKPDGSTVLTTYTGRATQVSDEGNGAQRIQRISQTDGLGRLVSVCEVSGTTQAGSSNNTPSSCGLDISGSGFLTSYQYDVLGNLKKVFQAGLGNRTFTYDLLSRLVCGANPEVSNGTCPDSDSGSYVSGTIRYTYDNNGNLKTKIAPKPNQTNPAVTVTTTYSYDALNRIFKREYSDLTTTSGTPTVNIDYDTSTELGVSGLTNTTGRKSGQWVVNGAGQKLAGSVFSYDEIGRIKKNAQCTPQNCPSNGTFSIDYTYNLAGAVRTGSNGAGTTLTYDYDGAGHLNSVTSTLSDANHPGTLFSNTIYGPVGLTQVSLGNGLTEYRSYNQRGWVQSQQDALSAALPGKGSVNIGGTLHNYWGQTQAATHSTGTLWIDGSENWTYPCSEWDPISGDCVEYSTSRYWDSGEVDVEMADVNNPEVDCTIGPCQMASAGYQYDSTRESVAAALASSINASPSRVSASLNGNYITLQSIGTGSSTNYYVSTQQGSYDPWTFGGSSFDLFPWNISQMSGGQDAQYGWIPDSGRTTIKVNNHDDWYDWSGSGTTAVSIAQGLCRAINNDGGAYVYASTVSGALNDCTGSNTTIALTARTPGSGTNYSLSVSSPGQNSFTFSCPGFSSCQPEASAHLSGGLNPSSTIYSFNITSFAPNGDIRSANDQVNGNWTYTYDDLNRLKTAVGSTGNGCTESYDRYGNRWTQDPYSGSCTSPHYSFTGGNNRMDTYSYDAAGNLLNDGCHAYSYDAENRIVSVSPVGSCTGSSAYVYDAEGRRVRRTATAENLDYLYDLSGRAVTLLNASTSASSFGEVFAGDRHLATYSGGVTSGGVTYFPLTDWLGTTRLQALGNGTTSQTCTNLPFGDSLNCNWYDPGHLHFTGKERDSESGLDYFGARYYGSVAGRFTSPDLGWFFSTDLAVPQSWNLYSYVQNNPLNHIDPDGYDCVYLNDAGNGAENIDKNSNAHECGDNGGYWVDGTVTKVTLYTNSNDVGLSGMWETGDKAGQLTDSYYAGVSAVGNPVGTIRALDDSYYGHDPDNFGDPKPNVIYYREFDPWSIRMFGTHWCGPGGGGVPVNELDAACKAHDECFDAAGISAANNTGGGTMTLQQAAAASACNQALYEAARAHPELAGSTRVKMWLKNGDKLSILTGGMHKDVLAPGTRVH